MPRDTGPRDRKCLGELPDRCRVVAEDLQHRAPALIRQCVQHPVHRANVPDRLYTCQGTQATTRRLHDPAHHAVLLSFGADVARSRPPRTSCGCRCRGRTSSCLRCRAGIPRPPRRPPGRSGPALLVGPAPPRRRAGTSVHEDAGDPVVGRRDEPCLVLLAMVDVRQFLRRPVLAQATASSPSKTSAACARPSSTSWHLRSRLLS